MVTPRLTHRRSLATLTLYTALLGAAYATACGDSSSEEGDGGGKKTGGASGTATGGTSGKGGTTGDGGTGGTTGGRGGTTSTGGKGGTGTGGSAGKGGTTSTGGAPGGQGGEGDMGGETNGGAGGEGGSGTVGSTCKTIHDESPAEPSGVFMIDPPGNTGAAFSVYCDMTTDGGGWTLGFLKNSVDNGHYQDFGSSYVNVAALATAPTTASATTTTTALAGWVDLNTFPYSALKLGGYKNGAQTYISLAIQKTTLRLMFGQNGYYLYNDVNGYYWCGGDNAYTTNGVGQENKPNGAPDDCKGHTSLGDGWDFSNTNTTNQGLTICGGASAVMTTGPTSPLVAYGTVGAAQAIWVR